jgi:D-glycero-D-manno-heptose 1,7-bisphosphate phosphatase
MKNKAIFLDRDGVINELVYYEEHGLLDSPSTIKQFKMFPWVGESISKFHELGYKVIIISNQPGIAKGHFSYDLFEKMKGKMRSELALQGDSIDAEYYCLHHPEAIIESLRINCQCRKPKPGLLLEAARDMDLELNSSWMIGDGLTDIQAGRDAGCKTILIAKIKCEFCQLMNEKNIKPDAFVSNLKESLLII